MSKLEELIQQYCPDGVEWKTLYSITKQFSGMTGVSNKWAEEGNCVFIDYNNVYNHTSVDTTALKIATVKSLKQNTLKKGDILFTSASETPDECALSSVIEKDLPDGVFLDDHLFGLRLLDEYSSVISPSYLKYAFRSEQFRFQIKKVVRGATRHYVSKVDFMKLEIPVPPLPVQEEIVRILDNFTELQAELQAELQKRKQQYNYYLDNLLNFKNINRGGYQAEVRWMKLKDVCMKTSNIKWKSTTGQYRYIDLSSVDIQTHSIISTIEIDNMSAPSRAQQIVQEDDVIFATTRPTQMRACIIPTQYNGDICSTGYCVLRVDTKILLPRFLFFSLTVSGFKTYLSNNLTLGNYPSISNNTLLEYEVPVPSLANQQRIVAILDRFDRLTNDLTSGLPAEIEKRRQQYEYYRDKLLTFKRKGA